VDSLGGKREKIKIVHYFSFLTSESSRKKAYLGDVCQVPVWQVIIVIFYKMPGTAIYPTR